MAATCVAVGAGGFVARTSCALESQPDGVLSRTSGGALGAASLWERFVQHLRAGQLPEAYACFSPLSRATLPYDDFASLYHPAGSVTEAVLSPAEEGQLRVDGDLAEFRFVARPPGGTAGLAPGGAEASAREGVLVTAVMVREGEAWHLIAAARLETARTEAMVRNLLRALWRDPGIRAARAEGRPLGGRTLAETAGATLDGPEAGFVRNLYDLALARGADGLELIAAPREGGYRAFHIDPAGHLRPVGEGAAAALLLDDAWGEALPELDPPHGTARAARPDAALSSSRPVAAASAAEPSAPDTSSAAPLPPLATRGDPAVPKEEASMSIPRAGTGSNPRPERSPRVNLDRPPPPPPLASGSDAETAPVDPSARIASWTEMPEILPPLSERGDPAGETPSPLEAGPEVLP